MQDGKSSVEFSLAIPLVEMGGKKLKLSTTKKKPNSFGVRILSIRNEK